MGQTLTNGIYLPAEGERNCYEGLAANWTALDSLIGGYNVHIGNTAIHVTAEDKAAWNGKADASALTAHTGDTTIHVTAEDKAKWDAVTSKADASALTAHTGDTTIHVTAEDKQAWNGKADASALTAHTGDNTIHVTAEDKTKWDAVTGKADDSGVVHKAGAETIAGEKTFTDDTFFNSVRATSSAETGGQGSTILPLLSILTFRNRDPSIIARLNFRALGTDGSKSLYPHENNQYSLGLTSRRYSNVFSYSINGLNPGALSLPNLSAGVDISGYITNLNKGVNTYTPPANGYVSIRVRKMTLDHVSIRIQQSYGLTNSSETADFSTWGIYLPVVAGNSVEVYIYADALVGAYFFPCQGNI